MRLLHAPTSKHTQYAYSIIWRNRNCFSILDRHSTQLLNTLGLDPYLKQRLVARRLLPLKDFQIETFKKVTAENKNCFINSCTGSGKTLAYLLPLLDNLLKHKAEIKKNTRLSNESEVVYDKKQRHGAVILTLNKELSLQVYKQIRLLDVQNRLNCFRVGPISHFSPVIDLLNKKEKSREDYQRIEQSIEQNVVRCVDWSRIDVLIGTPQMFYNVLTAIAHNRQSSIVPKYVVVDEADLLLEIDQNLSRYTRKMLGLGKDYAKKIKEPLLKVSKEMKEGTKFLLSSSSFPLKVEHQPSKQYLEANFPPIDIITGKGLLNNIGINKHRLPDRIQLKYIEVQTKRNQDNPQGTDKQVDKEKLFYLSQIFSDPQRKGNRYIVFCNNKATVEMVTQFLEKHHKISCIQYYAALPSDQRSLNLFKFANEGFQVLVSTDLGSRGLDFTRPVHTVVEFDMSQNIVNFINRAGRTGRNNLPGQVLSFVEEKNRIFFGHLSQMNSHNQEFSGLFSRKRSYNKLVLKSLQTLEIALRVNITAEQQS